MYDAMIIGARCAGAATAMLLVRKSYKVLLVDRASLTRRSPQTRSSATVAIIDRSPAWRGEFRDRLIGLGF